MNQRTSSLWLWLLFTQFFCVPAIAETVRLDAWLRTDVGPALTRLVNNEPRFLGEPISIVAMEGGRVVNFNDQLTLRIRDHLKQMLLARSNARIPVAGSPDTCSPASSPIALGIEVKRFDSQRHRVHLAFLDLDENLWINGSSQVWVGRLDRSSAELFNSGHHQSVETVKVGDTTKLATHLTEQLRCNQFAAPVYVSGENPQLQEAVHQALSQHYVMTDKETDASTKLRLIETDTSVSLRFDNAEHNNVLASVKVAKPAPEIDLISDIKLSERKGDCRGHGSRCVDIEYEVRDDAFIFEFFSHNGRLVLINCERPQRRQFGRVTQALKIPEGHRDGSTRPALGFYVLAVRDPQSADQLSTMLSSRHSCATSPDRSQLAALAEFVTTQPVTWRTIHFTEHRGRIRTI